MSDSPKTFYGRIGSGERFSLQSPDRRQALEELIRQAIVLTPPDKGPFRQAIKVELDDGRIIWHASIMIDVMQSGSQVQKKVAGRKPEEWRTGV